MSKRTTSSFINSCERIRPERSRNPCIRRLVWSENGYNTRYPGYDANFIEDVEVMNPRTALRRLLRLYEGRQYREAASFVSKLPRCTLGATLPDIPVDLVIETLPRSLALLESLYSRLPELDNVKPEELARLLRVEQLLWKVVHLISLGQDQHRVRIWSKLLLAISRVSPNIRKLLIARKKALDDTIEGLGKHGLIPCSIKYEDKRVGQPTESQLLPLSAKLKEELEARIDAYKLALHKIENLGKDAVRRSKGDPHGLRSASHQRLLSLKYSEVQQRLIDNQSLLNTLEKASGRNLEELSNELARRVEQDKEALRQWMSLRKSSGEKDRGDTKEQPALATRLLQFSRACGLALELMNNPSVEPRSSWCGEFFSTLIEDERFDVAAAESSSAGYHTDDSCSPEPISYLSSLPVSEVYKKKDDVGFSSTFFELTTQQLTEKYVGLYAQAHLHTLDALDALETLKDATDLKSKILFSVLVLSWRIADSIQTARKHEAADILSGPDDPDDPNRRQLSDEIEVCMRRQLATSGFESGTRQVALRIMDQLKNTLYDYPCLETCEELQSYALSCARLAWACLARETPLVLDTIEPRQRFAPVEFRREFHARHHSSPNSQGKRIVGVVWPGLRQANLQGTCLYRAVVLTA
ncbi:uncharacterized protein [Chelonus insularis]|uniref:uncharacterized protein n=1 Tax=Chelonus insularis TaxID=460826 RepID=UPI001588913A|nr:uncharacterized protein LOC118067173 [Chelonus insularis]